MSANKLIAKVCADNGLGYLVDLVTQYGFEGLSVYFEKPEDQLVPSAIHDKILYSAKVIFFNLPLPEKLTFNDTNDPSVRHLHFTDSAGNSIFSVLPVNMWSALVAHFPYFHCTLPKSCVIIAVTKCLNGECDDPAPLFVDLLEKRIQCFDDHLVMKHHRRGESVVGKSIRLLINDVGSVSELPESRVSHVRNACLLVTCAARLYNYTVEDTEIAFSVMRSYTSVYKSYIKNHVSVRDSIISMCESVCNYEHELRSLQIRAAFDRALGPR